MNFLIQTCAHFIGLYVGVCFGVVKCEHTTTPLLQFEIVKYSLIKIFECVKYLPKKPGVQRH